MREGHPRVVLLARRPDNRGVPAPEPFATDSTPALSALTPRLDALAERLGVKSVLVMRSEPDAMVVAATAGEATRHYTVGAAGKKAGSDASRIPLYCERVVNTDDALYVRDSRDDETFAGNEDETEFGLHNYLGVPVHDGTGRVVGTVCVLDDTAREYSDDDRAELEKVRAEVEQIVATDDEALG
jgi:GAF domain-containing protein